MLSSVRCLARQVWHLWLSRTYTPSMKAIWQSCCSEMRILLFQAVREALFNVVKHAGTDRATISVTRSAKEIQIQIGDHGRGFVVDQILKTENATGGLMNIRHRLLLMGCDLQIESHPEKGTKVVIRVPADQVHA